MAIPGSGAISLNTVQTEFGGSNPIGSDEYYRGGAYVTTNNTSIPTSGTIALNNFYNTKRQFTLTISTNQTNANLRTLAVNAGWNQSDYLSVVINSGVYISSNSTAIAALVINGSFPNGVALTNSGFIVGMGGNGARGGATAGGGYSATSGGPALSVASAVSITNNGTIAGGGGGGGGGQGAYAIMGSGGSYYTANFGGGGGGGGRSSLAANSSGGAGGPVYNTYGGLTYGSGGNGGGGTSTGPGGGGAGGGTINYGKPGGTGGGWGTAGSAGGTGLVVETYYYSGTKAIHAGGSAGAAGTAISGNSNITWISTGTRLGVIA